MSENCELSFQVFTGLSNTDGVQRASPSKKYIFGGYKNKEVGILRGFVRYSSNISV